MYLHFTNAHDSPIMIECMDFDSFDDFKKWRENIEKESRTQFVESLKKPQSDGAYQTSFVCSLSKESEEKCVDGGFCPAEITLCTTPEKCSILFVKTHIGHNGCRVNDDTKEIIAEWHAGFEPLLWKDSELLVSWTTSMIRMNFCSLWALECLISDWPLLNIEYKLKQIVSINFINFLLYLPLFWDEV